MGALEELSIRRANGDDLPALHALVERAYRGDSARGGWTHEADILGGQRIGLAELDASIAATDRLILVAEQGGAIVGSVEITDRGDGLTYLGLLSVDPARQGSGLGRLLVGEAELSAREAFGADRMEMTVIAQRGELIAWYERRGYVLTGERRPFPHVVEGVIFHGGVPPEMVVLERAL